MLSLLRFLDARVRRWTSRRRKRSRRQRSRFFEPLECRNLFSATPYGAVASDTGEFMLGNVSVTVVLMESSSQTSSVNNNSENWTSDRIASVKSNIREGLDWWTSALHKITTRHELNFQIDFTYADAPVATRFEPITNPSTAFSDWMYDFLNVVGYNQTGNFSTDIRSFNNSQREKNHTDWAYTIFVVNDQNDADGNFYTDTPKAPGQFEKAFAFAGGRFFVMPASRPASTVSHESGHMFWALDEYPSGGTYTSKRGYYATQNSNAWDNPLFRDPSSGQVQQPSIMASGTNPGDLLYRAYEANTSSQSSLELIGWKDSDGDGVFDVLDVPLTLTGSGYYDPATSLYHFVGSSSVQTLANLNPSGNRNDVTINRVSRLEYRFDGGQWQTATEYGTYTASIDSAISMPATVSQIELRTVDAVTEISSPIFVGIPNHAASTDDPGVHGFVFDDTNANGVWDTAEHGLAGVQVQLVDQNGAILPLQTTIEPDAYSTSTDLSRLNSRVTLSATGLGVANSSVTSLASGSIANAGQVFGNNSSDYDCQGACSLWNEYSRQLRLDFTQAVTYVGLDMVADSNGDAGRLEVYNTQGKLLGRYTTAALSSGNRETMSLAMPTAEIAYAIAYGHMGSAVMFDSLRFGVSPTSVTDKQGLFRFADLPEGHYNVRVVSQSRQVVTAPADGVQSVDLARGDSVSALDFGLNTAANRWQNPTNHLDVNNDGWVTPIDVLQIINSLNLLGARVFGPNESAPPYLDTSGDGQLAPGDALIVINELNRRAAAGWNYANPNTPTYPGGGALGEGEASTLGTTIRSNASANTKPSPPSLPPDCLPPPSDVQRPAADSSARLDVAESRTLMAWDACIADLFGDLSDFDQRSQEIA